MAANDELMGFAQRFKAIEANQDTSNGLIKDLIAYGERVRIALQREVSLRQVNMEEATTTNRKLQQQIHEQDQYIHALSQENQYLRGHNPYIMVLIDGDGMLFRNHFIRQGLEGGKKAAYALRETVLEEYGTFSDDMEVVAKVCANITGLAKAMTQYGCIQNKNELKEFSLGFSQAKASFDFVDVGFGKERADFKIRETAKWHLRNHNCLQLFLGISHDSGYAPFLDEILRDKTTRQRVTIMEGVPTVRELVATGVKIKKFSDTLFRPDKLMGKQPSQNTAQQKSQV